MKKLVTLFGILILLMGCSNVSSTTQPNNSPSAVAVATQPSPSGENNSASNGELIGKKIKIYSEQWQVEIAYLTPEKLHWKNVTPGATPKEADAKMSYKKLNDYQHFVSWIEEDGVTISQVVDTKAMKVYEFASYKSEKSPLGGREGRYVEGKIEFVN
ncbi:MAG TPA: hypothetical protein V6D28_25330 [Leptolyngbyaceae cyanobacterium]